MAQIDPNTVKELREKTGCGMMDCKKALVETDGSMEKAAELLRKKGLASATKRTGKQTGNGVVEAYIHLNGRIGVMVELNCETDFVARNPEFSTLARDIAMQVAASSPQYLKREDVPESVINSEKEVLKAAALAEGKPEKVAEKMVEGRLEKFYSQVCLIDQPFIKELSKSIGELIKEHIAKFGENIQISRFSRYQVGEKN
ncbi:MAG: translation elongation factor Ts [Candidatus Margulisiibacteriota bacterium]